MISHSPRPTWPESSRGIAVGDHQQATKHRQGRCRRLGGDIGAPKSSQSLAATTAGVRATTSAPRPASIIVMP
jgi:hypothetical protein